MLQLLEEFNDLVPEKLHAELLSTLAIQHNIDLHPSTSLPNIPHYRMSPKRHDIWKAMGDDLLEKKFGASQPELMCCANIVGSQKGWFLSNVYRQQGYQQDYYEI